MPNKLSLIFGGSGALGKSVINSFKRSSEIINIDFKSNPKVDQEIILQQEDFFFAHDQKILNNLKMNLKDQKLDSIINVAGGFSMVDIHSPNVLQSLMEMFKKNSVTSLISAHIASQYLKNNGLLVLTGALYPFDNPASDMLTYSLTKNFVHNLTISLKNDKIFQEKNLKVVTILPSIIDTEVNRKSMPDVSKSDWIPTDKIAQLLYSYSEDGAPESGSFVELQYKNKSLETKFRQ